MKKKTILTVLKGLCAVLFLANCGGDSASDGPTLSVSPSSVTLGENNSETLSVTSNTEWNVSRGDSWVNCSPSSATGSRQVTVSANSTTSVDRSTYLTFTDKTGTKSVTVQVTQKAASGPTPPSTLTLEINKRSLSFPALGGNDSFTITSNTSWTVSSDQSWCTVSPTASSNDGTVSVKADENKNASSRSANIIVRYGDKSVTVAVNQAAADAPAGVQMVLKDMLERPFGTVDLDFHTATYSKIKTILSGMFTFEEKSESGGTYFFINKEENPSLGQYTYLGHPLSSLCVRNMTSSFYVEYVFYVEKSVMPNPYLFMDQIAQDFNNINIPISYKLDPYPDNPEALAEGYLNVGGFAAGSISYWYNLYDRNTSYRFEIGVSYHI